MIIHLLSGGIDSTVMLYDYVNHGYSVHAALANYGQTHGKELTFAKHHCERLNVPWTEIELFRIKGIFQRCALTDKQSESVIVPNRNMVLLSIAAAMAQGMGADYVTIGCNADDPANFPDCSDQFLIRCNRVIKFGAPNVTILSPYIRFTKRQIVELGRKLNVPLEETWSCYAGGKEPCGTCDACMKRNLALCSE